MNEFEYFEAEGFLDGIPEELKDTTKNLHDSRVALAKEFNKVKQSLTKDEAKREVYAAFLPLLIQAINMSEAQFQHLNQSTRHEIQALKTKLAKQQKQIDRLKGKE